MRITNSYDDDVENIGESVRAALIKMMRMMMMMMMMMMMIITIMMTIIM